MQLTNVGKIVAGLVLAAVLGLGYYYFGDDLQAINNKSKETEAEMATKSPEPNEASAANTASSEASASNTPNFSYVSPEPINGTLKGVVELGASGFNSFIVRIDKDKNWKLEKSEFGNSLVNENMATDEDIRTGLKKYIAGMLDFGVGGKGIHFVVSSGAVKAEATQKIVKNLKTLGYYVNTVTPEQEGALGLKCVLPKSFEDESFVADIGSGNTKISWRDGSSVSALETYGAKYFQNGTSDDTVADEVQARASMIPKSKRKTCFIIGGIPFELAKQVREGKERYTVLKAPADYKMENAKGKAGLNIYKNLAKATGCEQFVFDSDANFTIGFLLNL